MSDIDYLEPDVITQHGSNFGLMSVVSPTSNQKADKLAVKFRSCVFSTQEEASKWAEKLGKMEGHMYDIYVVQLGHWLPMPPDNDKIPNQEYSEKQLNDLIKGYQESQVAAKEQFEERKRGVMKDGLDKHLSPDEKIEKIEEVGSKFASIQSSIHRVEGITQPGASSSS